MPGDLNRLRAVLNASGLQSRDNATWQVISEMLYALIGISRSLIIKSAEAGEIFPGGGGSGGGSGSGGMEYLGAYAPGTTYNDGDIVIGDDGVAYVCTVNGTTTPPDPWPGAGIATSDATFWTVDPHPGLANERALSSLANGYVKSTAGVPSTVAAIPAGDLPPFIAYTNVNNNFSVLQTLPEGSIINGANPHLYFNSPAATAGNKYWRLLNYQSDPSIRFEAMTDDFSTVVASFQFNRNGYLYSANFSGGGAGLTNLNASQLTTGLVATARLGSGTANSSTFLRGDSTWQVPPTAEGVPVGALILMTVPCPPGYTRVAGWDGYYARMGPVHTSGGASQHQHGPGTFSSQNHTHPAGTLTVPSHSHAPGSMSVDSHNHGSVTVGFGISGTTGAGGGHSHSFSAGTNASGSNMNVDAGSSGLMARSDHVHSVSGDTDSVANHTHTFSGSGSGSGATGNASPGISGNTSTQAATTVTGASASAGAAAITGLSDIQLNNPLYIDFYACRKD